MSNELLERTDPRQGAVVTQAGHQASPAPATSQEGKAPRGPGIGRGGGGGPVRAYLTRADLTAAHGAVVAGKGQGQGSPEAAALSAQSRESRRRLPT